MRNAALRAALEEFAADAGGQLSAARADGEEIPFELEPAGGGRGRPPLYCYRPLTGTFIRERQARLAGLASYAPAIRALSSADGLEAYLRDRGEPRVPAEPHRRAETALQTFLRRMFDERSDFGLDPARFEVAYEELERALYEGRCVTTVIAPLLGVALDPQTRELRLGEGLSLMPGEQVEDAPAEALWRAFGSPAQAEEANVLLVLGAAHDRDGQPVVGDAHRRFRLVLTALRLFEPGDYALGPLAWMQRDGGAWLPLALGAGRRPRVLTMIRRAQEDELCAFCNLVARRVPSRGELAWALGRFEMGWERPTPFEALSDHLLALRALLEPEGPSSGRLPGRLAVLCAPEAERSALAERVAQATELERAVVAGLAGEEDHEGRLAGELAEHLRALLRDVICGHLDADLRTVADELLNEAITLSPS